MLTKALISNLLKKNIWKFLPVAAVTCFWVVEISLAPTAAKENTQHRPTSFQCCRFNYWPLQCGGFVLIALSVALWLIAAGLYRLFSYCGVERNLSRNVIILMGMKELVSMVFFVCLFFFFFFFFFGFVWCIMVLFLPLVIIGRLLSVIVTIPGFLVVFDTFFLYSWCVLFGG